MSKYKISLDFTFIIAEAGVNHNGDTDLALKMIDIAADAGADAVKFQTFKAERLLTQYAPKASYQNKTTKADESQFEMIKNLELSKDAHRVLIDYCSKKNIMFLSSPFDNESIDLLDELGLKIFKIPSGEIVNLPYLRKIGSIDKNIIMSTGMANLEEVDSALNILVSAGTELDKITLLSCNTEYPTPFEDTNLNTMLTLRERFNTKVGYSDHTPGIEVPIAAVAMGAVVIEKHFTLDRNMLGPDHKASLEPVELKSMIMAIRNIEKAMGTGIKAPSPSEIKNIAIARKSIVSSTKIMKGELFSEDNLSTKRPGTGISPMRWDEFIGTKASKDYQKDEQIKEELHNLK